MSEIVRAGQVWSHPEGDFGPFFVVAVSALAPDAQTIITYRMTNDSSRFWSRTIEDWQSLGLVRRR